MPAGSGENIFYDPFAPEGAQEFSPTAVHARLEERYLAGEVEHDYSADDFVRDTEALMMDAAFAEDFQAIQEIALRMELLCDVDHGGDSQLQIAVESNATVSSAVEVVREDAEEGREKPKSWFNLGSSEDDKKRKKAEKKRKEKEREAALKAAAQQRQAKTDQAQRAANDKKKALAAAAAPPQAHPTPAAQIAAGPDSQQPNSQQSQQRLSLAA